ncbi:hypothetical protein [Sphingobacterium multivorum]|uniref:hypothetical protein n=1 Tax=Sphingobacterium multivorum TaxID=28454 RepID=UPI002FD978F1
MKISDAINHKNFLENNIQPIVKGKTIRFQNGSNERLRSDALTDLTYGAKMLEEYCSKNYDLVDFYAKVINTDNYLCESFDYDHVEGDLEFIIDELNSYIENKSAD